MVQLETMQRILILLLAVNLITLSAPSKTGTAVDIHIRTNQIGYLLTEPKVALVLVVCRSTNMRFLLIL